jgi:phosphatidylserine/phosphatidylglycerophosphate/cardiolipin synthase-like enzyme
VDKLLGAISDLVSNTPPERVEQLADRVRELNGPTASGNLKSWALTPGANERLGVLTSCWNSSGIPSGEFAGMLIGASYAYRHAESESDMELVWTGPSSELVATRKTEQALLEVINSASKKLFLTSFVAYDVASIIGALTTLSTTAVEISMLLESSDKHGGGISIDAIGPMKKAIPAAKIYYWGEKAESFVDGKVHAKVAVSDESICFISSANLTGHAMEKNMEAGVLIRGGTIPSTLHRHLEALVTTKVLKRA